jgi:hypothetical protein
VGNLEVDVVEDEERFRAGREDLGNLLEPDGHD